MKEELFFTHFLNQYLGGIATRILSGLGAHPVAASEKSQYLFTYNPAAPITNFFAMEVLVLLILLVLFLWARARISVDKPSAMQHVFELTALASNGDEHLVTIESAFALSYGFVTIGSFFQ